MFSGFFVQLKYLPAIIHGSDSMKASKSVPAKRELPVNYKMPPEHNLPINVMCHISKASLVHWQLWGTKMSAWMLITVE